MDESSHRRLAFILYLYRLGIDQARHPEPLNAAAILTFHDSVELLLGLACEQRNVGSKRMHFDEYFTQLDPLFPPNGVAERVAMIRLNSARVELKHRGTMPSPSAISSFRDSVASFFEANAPLIFGVPLSDVSLAHLVTLPEAREAVLQAERDSAEGRLAESLEHLALAFAFVLRDHRIRTETYYDISMAFLGQSAEERDVREIGSILRHVVEAVQKLELEVGMLRYGIDTRRFDAFRKICPTVRFAAAGNPLFTGPRATNPTDDQVRFCYDFVIDSVLNIQQSEAATQPFTRT